MRSGAAKSELLAGRTQELSELVAAYEAAAAGEARTVFLSGEPGIGKTRLLDRFADQVFHAGGLTLRGNCYEDASMVPYAPFVEVLRQLATQENQDMHLTDNPHQLLSLPLSSVSGESFQSDSAFPQGLTHNMAPEARLQLFDAVARQLAVAAQQRPIVLLLDDLHWSDEPSALLLRYIARVLRTSTLLIVGAYRDTDLVATLPFEGVLRDLQRERLATRISLRRLVPEETTEIVGHLLDARQAAIAPSVIETIQHESEGVPFFIEELVLHLREESLLTRQPGGRWELATGAEAAIPQSIRSVVGHRLDHTSSSTRDALSVAAVIGNEFSFDVLQTVLKQRGWEQDEELVEAIEEAAASRLIIERKPGRQSIETRYAFAHEQIHSVLYWNLNAIRRRALHQLVAETIERLSSDAVADASRLAYHYSHGEDLRKAADYAILAAEEATRYRAVEEAVRQYDSALEIIDLIASPGDLTETTDEERVHILLARNSLLEARNDSDRQSSGINQLFEIARRSGRDDWELEAHIRAARHNMREGDQPAALEHATAAYDLARPMDQRAQFRSIWVVAEAHTGRLIGEPSRLYRPKSDLVLALKALTEARELAEQLDYQRAVAWIAQEMGVVLWQLANPDDQEARARARTFLFEALDGFRATEDQKGEITALIALAYRRPIAASKSTGAADGSFVAFLEEIRRLRKTEHLLSRNSERPRMEALSLLSIEMYARTRGWYEIAMQRAEQALEWAAEARETRIMLLSHLALSETERQIGRFTRSLEHANRAAAIFETGQDAGRIRNSHRDEVLGALATANLAIGNNDHAIEIARERLELARNRGQRWRLAEATVGLAEAFNQVDDGSDEAAEYASEALHHAADLPGTITWDIRALLVLARVALASHDAPAAIIHSSAAVSRIEARETLLTWLVTAAYLLHGQALEASGQQEPATVWFERAFELIETTAERFESDDLRETYLTFNATAREVREKAIQLKLINVSSSSPVRIEPIAGLTPREFEVIGLVAAGKTNREISADLFISEKTVARHLTNIFNKIDAQSRTQAVAWAFQNGIA